MRYRLIIIVLFIAVLTVPACKDNLHLSELERLQGRWHLVKNVHQGREAPPEEIKNGFMVFDAENTWHVEVDGKTIGGGTFKVDPDKSPKTIDYTFSEGEEKGQNFLAIYELSGDSFKHCGVMDGERPSAFEAESGSKSYLVSFERVKENFY